MNSYKSTLNMFENLGNKMIRGNKTHKNKSIHTETLHTVTRECNQHKEVCILYDDSYLPIREIAQTADKIILVPCKNKGGVMMDKYIDVCKNCKYSIDEGDSVEYIWCKRKGKRKIEVKKSDSCSNFEVEEGT